MKKILSALLILIMTIPIIVNATSIKTGKFTYKPAFNDGVKEEVYYYSDDYFKETGKTYNEHLMTMSYNLAISTFEVQNSAYSSKLLTDIGFKDIKTEDINKKPTTDTIGTIIAHKKVNGYNLVAVAVRGANYDSEWANNFIVGKTGNAKGFDDTSKKVINRIKKYIEDNNLTKVKIWMTGYSRAGAVSDLTAVYINNNLNEFNTTANDLYVYTFEAPAASIDNTTYDNIYCVINNNDIIPFVYPKEWGFYRNGKTIDIGEDSTIKTYIGLTDIEEYKDVNRNEFLNEFFSFVTSKLSREEYVDNLEERVSNILDIYFSKSDEDREKIKNFITVDVKDRLFDEENKTRIGMELLDLIGHNSDYLYEKFCNDIVSIMEEKRNTENAQALTEAEFEYLKESIYPILRTLGPIMVDDNFYYEGIDYDEFYNKFKPEYKMNDTEMGKFDGQDVGESRGYDDGFAGEPKDTTFDYIDDFGPEYVNAFNSVYAQYYEAAYEIGKEHRSNLAVKGTYDGEKEGRSEGISAYQFDYDYEPHNNYKSIADWMTEEYLTNYHSAYTAAYIEGYEYAKTLPPYEEEPEYECLYHFMTIIKNLSNVIEHHYPQKNLELIHKKDSYYNDYDITEGKDQTIDISQNTNDIVIKTNGLKEKFVKVQIDNKDIDNYTFNDNTITLSNSYIKNLSIGTHTIKIIYIDKELITNITIVDKNTNNTPNRNSNYNKSVVIDNIVNEAKEEEIKKTDSSKDKNKSKYKDTTNKKQNNKINNNKKDINIIPIIIIICFIILIILGIYIYHEKKKD